ncbi:LytTR family two component transcriptional regulator [Lacibacter cauensis]|uniref:LytTR family two component transcriptional regulator n=1 Tax=Lacibacter cauensis TaxID=510947 RepID=A0A562SXA6_9BACT|nr:LytTR family DNA-binding domain-containing protein [Lacibacter cauensis]TWI85793.1 LytTR family two component transcriptional regulator [Lacibacter cauensis]
MVRYKCVVIEDEPLAAEILTDYISQIPFLELKQVYSDALTALEFLKSEKADVLFIDIHLPRLNGLDFIKTLSNPPQIILTTAYREYALEGYEHNVVDYLLKPISFSRFLTAVNKLKNNLPVSDIIFSDNKGGTDEKQHIYINVNKRRIKIDLDEILFIESKREYISIVTREKTFLTKFQLSEIEKHLDKGSFIRVHRSFIVAKSKITAFTSADVDIKGMLIPIGRSYKELVLSVLGESI